MEQKQDISEHIAHLIRQSRRFLPPDLTMKIECASESDPSEKAREELARRLSIIFRAGLSGGELCPQAELADVFLLTSPENAATFSDFPSIAASGAVPAHSVCENCAVLPLQGEAESDKLIVLPYCARRKDAVLLGKYTTFCPALADRIADVVCDAYENLCPPLVIGIGAASTKERAVLLSRVALSLPTSRAVGKFEKQLQTRLCQSLAGMDGAVGRSSVLSVRCLGESGIFACSFGCRYTMRAEMRI